MEPEKAPVYGGPCEITPEENDQVLACAGHLMPADLVIKPVPPGYGSVGWNGITLTIS